MTAPPTPKQKEILNAVADTITDDPELREQVRVGRVPRYLRPIDFPISIKATPEIVAAFAEWADRYANPEKRLRTNLAPPERDGPPSEIDRENDRAREWASQSLKHAGAAFRTALDPDRLRRWAAKTGDRFAPLRALALSLGFSAEDEHEGAPELISTVARTIDEDGLEGLQIPVFDLVIDDWLPAAARFEYAEEETALALLVRLARPTFAERISAREIEIVEPHRGRPLSRLPALLDAGLAAPLVAGEIETVAVDGEAIATPTALHLDDPRHQLHRIAVPERRTLFPLPRRIGGTETKDLTLLYLSGLPLTGDERRDGLLRADAYWLGCLIYALSGPVELSPAEAAALLTGENCPGSPSDSVRRRFNEAAALIGNAIVVVNPRTGERRRLALTDFGSGGRTVIGPPAWWRDRADRFRLTGSLYRARTGAGGRGRRTAAGRLEDWGSNARFLSGAEAALAYSRTAGTGRRPRTPTPLRPASGSTGPGEPIFIPWLDVLRLAGEHVPADLTTAKTALERRYRRRAAALDAAGYRVPGGPGSRRAAPAGDSIEIVDRIAGGRGRSAGLLIRASARFTEAQRLAEKADGRGFDRRPLAGLLPPGTPLDD